MYNFGDFTNKDKYIYENYEIEEFKFINGDTRGMIKIYFENKKETKVDYFIIHKYGNIAFDAFYPDDVYYDLVNYVYNQLPEGELKQKAGEYYDEILISP